MPKDLGMEFIEPMAVTRVPVLPEGPEWLYEVKWDGYRALLTRSSGRVRILSRTGTVLTDSFPEVVAAVDSVKAKGFILDAEIVALDDHGRPSFQELQAGKRRAGTVVAYAFDLLSLDGELFLDVALERRRARLQRLLTGSLVRFSASLDATPAVLIQHVRALGLEGIVAKRRSSRYKPGDRGRDWVKVRLNREQEFVIGGYLPKVEAILVGYFEPDGSLTYVGQVRAGFAKHQKREIERLLQPARVAKPRFARIPVGKGGSWGSGLSPADCTRAIWVEPVVVVQISFVEWTKAGSLRHPEFVGFRPDKKARDVVRED